MTDSDTGPETNRPRVIDNHEPSAEPKRSGPLGSIEGADRAALGLDARTDSAPSGAEVDPAETDVPGSHFAGPARDAKPWETTLATRSDDAGVGAEPDPEGEI